MTTRFRFVLMALCVLCATWITVRTIDAAPPAAPDQNELNELMRVALASPELLQKMHSLVSRHGMRFTEFSFRYDSPTSATWFLGYINMEHATPVKIEVEIRRATGGQPAQVRNIVGPTEAPEGPPPLR